MMNLEFNVEGTPVPKARARVVMRGKYPGAYTPQKSKNYETIVADAARLAMNEAGLSMTSEPCGVSLIFSLPIPKSASKKQVKCMSNGEKMHIKKPDLDNLIKQVFDAMNGIVWCDDSQVVSVTAIKVYSEVPSASIRIVGINKGDSDE